MRNALLLYGLLELAACGSNPQEAPNSPTTPIAESYDATLRMDCEQHVKAIAYVLAEVVPELHCSNGVTYNVLPSEFLGNARFEGEEVVGDIHVTDNGTIHTEVINVLNEKQAAEIQVACAQNGNSEDGLADLVEDLCTIEWQAR